VSHGLLIDLEPIYEKKRFREEKRFQEEKRFRKVVRLQRKVMSHNWMFMVSTTAHSILNPWLIISLLLEKDFETIDHMKLVSKPVCESVPESASVFEDCSTNVSPAFGDVDQCADEELDDIHSVSKGIGNKGEFEFECGISEYSETDTEGEEYDADVPSCPSDTDEEEARDKDRVTYAEEHGKNPDLSAGESSSH
jgi:hypothetical protein